MQPSFSTRTRWDLRPNPIATALEERRRRGEPILDLTESNPARCGLTGEGEKILRSLADERALRYEPEPKGLPAAREAIAALYAGRGVEIPPDRILLTASTSEAYAHLFRLLADPGDEVLVPAPSYPLFDFLARIGDVVLRPYPLVEVGGFRIDLRRLEEAATERTRAVLVVNPGNPTGNYLKIPELEALLDLCSRRGLALISDEVFGDYAAGPDPERVETVAGQARALTFALNGISKMLALPQMKLGWIVASGPEEMLAEALGRLEVIADTYLSVNTPVQVALPALLGLRERIQARIRSRLRANREALDRILRPPCPAHALPSEGGWSAVVRVPATRSDESWALALLQEDGVLVHPGFFFEFPAEGRLVLSLLPDEEVFREGAERLARRIAT